MMTDHEKMRLTALLEREPTTLAELHEKLTLLSKESYECEVDAVVAGDDDGRDYHATRRIVWGSAARMVERLANRKVST